MKDPALVKNQALGGFWIRTRRAQPIPDKSMCVSDLEWFVFDKDPDQGGEQLAHGRIDDTLDDKDADQKAGVAVVDAVCQLTRERELKKRDRTLRRNSKHDE